MPEPIPEPTPDTSPAPTDAEWTQIQTELFAGRKIEAIKFYRRITGSDLKDAKEAMDAYETKLRGEAPQRFTSAPAGKGGCMSMILLAVALAGAGWMSAKMLS